MQAEKRIGRAEMDQKDLARIAAWRANVSLTFEFAVLLYRG
jgi:hypothetical protein